MGQTVLAFDIEFDEARRVLCIAATNGIHTFLWTPEGYCLTPSQVRAFVTWLLSQKAVVVTWNGTQSDFAVLRGFVADDTSLSDLVRRHVDIPLIAAATMKTMMALRSVSVGVDIEHRGEDIPALWRDGHRDKVIAHLQTDVAKTLQVYQFLSTGSMPRTLPWTTAAGTQKSWVLSVGLGISDGGKLWTVMDCFEGCVPHTESTPVHCRCTDIVGPWLSK